MKSDTAIGNRVFIGLLLSGVIFYSVWCARIFWVAPGISFQKGFPNEASQRILNWHEANQYFLPEQFSRKRYFQALKNPREGVASPVSVRRVTDGMLIATHASRPGIAVRFIRDKDDWNSFEVQTGPLVLPGGPELSVSEGNKLGNMSLPDAQSTD
ncbi:MAG: hypothetical protein V4819_03915 [Verrucomicrobiota bacterium]